jgi:hypothetical protein
MLRLSLSARGLQNLQTVHPEGRFRFVVGSDTYECPFYVAGFLSRKIIQLWRTDKTTNEFVIETKDPTHLFGRFLSLGQGSEIAVDNSQLLLIMSFGRELGNEELEQIVMKTEAEDQNVRVCISRLCAFGPRERDISYLASHFYRRSSTNFRVRISVDYHLSQRNGLFRIHH